MKKVFLWIGLIGLIILLSVYSSPVYAGESSAINGAENYMAGAIPPPGFHLIDYTLFYFADEFKDGKGNDATPPGFDLMAIANVIRPIYVADYEILGANPAWHMVIPFVYQDIEVTGASEDETGFGDIYVSPLILGWHSETWHYAAGLDIIMPTGEYQVGGLNNLGSNHWTFEPAFAITGLFKNGFTVNAKLMYDIHTENDDTDLQTGDQFHMDYCAGYRLNDNWTVGVGGYYLKGVQNDEQNGVEVPDSKQQVIAIGPNVMYNKDKLSIVLQPDFEFDAENRPEGIATWLKIVYSF